jgi:hypothetical protein
VNHPNFNRGHFWRLAIALSLRLLLSGGDSEKKDVIVFYDAEGKVVRVLPAADVILIVPDRLLRPDPPLRPHQPPKKMVWPGGETKDEE